MLKFLLRWYTSASQCWSAGLLPQLPLPALAWHSSKLCPVASRQEVLQCSHCGHQPSQALRCLLGAPGPAPCQGCSLAAAPESSCGLCPLLPQISFGVKGGMKSPRTGVLVILQVLYWVYTFVSGLHFDTCHSFINLLFQRVCMLKNCCGLSWSVHNVDTLKIKYLIAFLKLLWIVLSVN